MKKIVAADAYEIFLQAIQSRHTNSRADSLLDEANDFVAFSDTDIKVLVDTVWSDRNESEEVRTKKFEDEVRNILHKNQGGSAE